MRSDFIERRILAALLEELTYPNQLVMRLCLKTGLRLDDVLSIPKNRLALRFSVREMKTGKSKRIYVGADLYRELCAWAFHNPKNADAVFLFPHRLKKGRHRTRQAVYKDVKKSAARLQLSGNISPHSARKTAAVREFQRTHSLEYVRRFLNHDRDITTLLYALADQICT